MDAGQREKDTRVGRSARKRETEIQQGRERERQTVVGERERRGETQRDGEREQDGRVTYRRLYIFTH